MVDTRLPEIAAMGSQAIAQEQAEVTDRGEASPAVSCGRRQARLPNKKASPTRLTPSPRLPFKHHRFLELHQLHRQEWHGNFRAEPFISTLLHPFLRLLSPTDMSMSRRSRISVGFPSSFRQPTRGCPVTTFPNLPPPMGKPVLLVCPFTMSPTPLPPSRKPQLTALPSRLSLHPLTHSRNLPSHPRSPSLPTRNGTNALARPTDPSSFRPTLTTKLSSTSLRPFPATRMI
jgi:hypothetical protein